VPAAGSTLLILVMSPLSVSVPPTKIWHKGTAERRWIMKSHPWPKQDRALEPGAVACACDPSYLGGRDQENSSSKTSRRHLSLQAE
jgi:hypothetical protein